jgi:hypothetical protein
MPGFKIPYTPDGCPAIDPGDGPSNLTETARRHRYMLEILEPLGDRNNGLLMFLKKCTRPAVEIDQMVIHSGQDEIHRPGKHHWKTVEFTFYEKLSGGSGDNKSSGLVTDDCAQRIYRWWAETTLVIRESRHNSPDQYMKTAQLQMLDGNGGSIWNYFLYDSWPCNVNPSDLSYLDTDLAEISVTLRYSKAREGLS